MIDCLVFDLDGTLLDTMADLADSTNDVLRMCGYPERTQEEIQGFVGHGARRLIFQAVPETATEEEAEAALALWQKHYPEQGYPKTKPYPGMLETLYAMKSDGVKLGVLSNKFDEATKGNVNRFLPGAFHVVYGERVGVPRKPDPTGLLGIVEELGSKPKHAAYVGDSPVDMQVAHNAGMVAVGVSWGFNSVDSLLAGGANVILDQPVQLLRYLAVRGWEEDDYY